MAKAVTFSVTAVPKTGAQGNFRNSISMLRTTDLKDCILSVFHISDTYARLSGVALPAPHTSTNAELRAYLQHRLAGDGTGLDFDVKIDRGLPSDRVHS